MRSPYRKLLDMAGCTYGDLEELVRTEGLEGAFARLAQQGVYVALDEFKGRRLMVRGSQTFHCEAHDFDNPVRPSAIAVSSGATRSAGTRTNYDFDL